MIRLIFFAFAVFTSSLGFSKALDTDLQTLSATHSEFTRVEFGHAVKEGVVLVKQTAFGQPTYSISYFVGGHPIKTRVLVKSYYEAFVHEAQNIHPLFKNRKPASSVLCRHTLRLISRDDHVGISEKRACLDEQSRPNTQKFVQWIDKMKTFTSGQGI